MRPAGLPVPVGEILGPEHETRELDALLARLGPEPRRPAETPPAAGRRESPGRTVLLALPVELPLTPPEPALP